MFKISKIANFTAKRQTFSIIRKFNDFQNNPQLTKHLQEIKEFTSENFQEIQRLLKSEKKVHIFQIYSLTKFLFIGTRLQVLLYSIATMSYGFYALYSKYYKQYYHRKTERARIMRIKILGSFIVVLFSSILGLVITLKLGKRVVKSIYYLPKEESFEINYFSLMCFNKTINVPIKNIQKLEKKRRFDSTIEYENVDHPKYKLLSTRGTGMWINRHLVVPLLKGGV